jgi:hypothetical protein
MALNREAYLKMLDNMVEEYPKTAAAVKEIEEQLLGSDEVEAEGEFKEIPEDLQDDDEDLELTEELV